VFLASLGYQMSDIERAVADGHPWTGDTPQASTLADASQAAGSSESPDSDTGPDSDHSDVAVQAAA